MLNGGSLFRRFEAEVIGSLPGWRGKSTPVGCAVPCERGLGEEDIFGASAYRRDGASGRPAEGAAEQGNRGGIGLPAFAGSGATGPDFREVAGSSGARSASTSQYWTDVDGTEADGAALKKKSLHAAEQETGRIRAERQLWQEETKQIDPARLIFLDESGVTTEMMRRYGRNMGGARLNEGVPAGSWKTMTVLGAIGISGWVAIMTIEAPTDGDVFLAYLDHVLCPQLLPGQIVVMDNLAAHKVDGVAERILQTGATLLYLPPYPPDFNPIEKCWAQLKQRLRVLKARSLPSLQDALTDALGILTPQNTAACYRHCGYGL
jgi:transposase